MADDNIKSLVQQLAAQQKEIERLKRLLDIKDGSTSLPDVFSAHDESIPHISSTERLDNPSIARYSRQLILPEIGVNGQLLLRNTSVLIVGCGGLGCPAAIYLSAAGIGHLFLLDPNQVETTHSVNTYEVIFFHVPVGRLGLVDHDQVEISNLHRQILHTEQRVDVSKSASAALACNELNSTVTCVPYHLALDSSNALNIIKDYDIVLDATDNVSTRYLLNDACILAGKPLVSGSALRFEGQLTVYNYEGGPCYRCLYPKPPPPETVTNCSDGGVLGVVPGIIGSLQALEAIKIALRKGSTYAKRLLLFDALDGTFKTIKLRAKQDKCVMCGENPTITKLIDYEQFCGARATDKDKSLSVLSSEDRISVSEYHNIVENKKQHILLDVRQPVELDICSLPNTTNLPMEKLHNEQAMNDVRQKLQSEASSETLPVFVVCRHGNDSQLAVKFLQDKLKDLPVCFKDIRGGLCAWAKHIDNTFPTY